MSFNLVAFSYSSDSIMYNYIEKQLESITILFPDLVIEHENESDSRLVKYSKYPDRFPAYIIFKNNSRKAVIHSKMTNEDFINWVSLNLS